MKHTSLANTTRRKVFLFQRGTELMAVLLLALIGTFLNLIFGWVALLFKPSPSTAGSEVSGFPAVVPSRKLATAYQSQRNQ